MRSYPTAAKGRRWKIIRAIESVINQTFQHWELWIVADFCNESYKIVEELYFKDDRIQYVNLEQSALWSGGPRNKGIFEAAGKYINYLDNDDMFDPNHLAMLDARINEGNEPDWLCFGDLVPGVSGNQMFWTYRKAILRDQFLRGGQVNVGTSNICHKKTLGVYWPVPDDKKQVGYDQDFLFVQSLKRASSNYIVTSACGGYMVCHQHPKWDI